MHKNRAKINLLPMLLILAIATFLILASASGVAAKGRPEHPEHPEHPVHPEHPEHPEHPIHPEHPARPDNVGVDDEPGDVDVDEDDDLDPTDPAPAEAGSSVPPEVNEEGDTGVSDPTDPAPAEADSSVPPKVNEEDPDVSAHTADATSVPKSTTRAEAGTEARGSGGYLAPSPSTLASEAPQLIFFLVSAISVFVSGVSLVSIFGRRRLAPVVTLEQLRDVSLRKWTTPGRGGSFKVR